MSEVVVWWKKSESEGFSVSFPLRGLPNSRRQPKHRGSHDTDVCPVPACIVLTHTSTLACSALHSHPAATHHTQRLGAAACIYSLEVLLCSVTSTFPGVLRLKSPRPPHSHAHARSRSFTGLHSLLAWKKALQGGTGSLAGAPGL